MRDIISDILRREGGFVNHNDDRGGPTNFGITQASLAAYRHVPASIQDVRDLSEDEARKIYVSEYLERPNFHRIHDEKLRKLVVDCGVNHGVSRAAKFLQRAAAVYVDGACGPKTLEQVNKSNAELLFRKVLAERIQFYGRLITRDPSQAVFAAGWMNRVAEFIEA